MAETLNTVTTVETTAPAEHDQAMLDAVARKEAELASLEQPKPQEKILGKFGSQDELVKAYQELEKKLGQKQPEAPATQEPLTEEKVGELLGKANVDLDAMADYYNANRSLSEEHYKTLEAAGISRSYVDQYLSGVEAEALQVRDQIYNEIGGEAAFKSMASWAASNLSPAELQKYNDAVDSGDLDVVRSAVMGLAFKYQKSVGRDPQLVNGGNAQVGGFESLAQLTAAMKDPRYNTDPAYRREVEQKLARSSIM